MMTSPGPREETVRFRHATFSARFPAAHRYTPAHFWMAPADEPAPERAEERPRVWRVGMTKFATRMLGELVEMLLEVSPGQQVAGGQLLGTVEGFKAVSDLYCVVDGEFIGSNPLLATEACLSHSDPHGNGWLYAVRGTPAPGHIDVHGYVALLAASIDRLRASRDRTGPGSDEP
ncbi:MAG: glycine cleavage system protein H, partial [Planctomycetia bacterium]